MTDIFVGSVSVGVVPDARGWNQKLRQQLVPSSGMVGDEVGKEMGKKITDQMGEAGDKSAGAFDETFRKRLKAALDALPKAKVDGDITPAERKLAELRAEIERISKEDIIDGDKATRELAKVDLELHKLARDADIKVKFNTNEARAQLALLRKDIEATGGTYGAGGKPGLLGRVLNILPGVNIGGGAAGAAPPLAGAAGEAGSAASAGGGLLTNPWVLGIGGGALAAAAPFAGQALGGLGIAGLGGGLAGLGILGALYGNVGKNATVSAQQLNTASLSVQTSNQRVANAQANLQKLESSGKATAAQLASAHLAVATAINQQATAQTNLTNLQKEANKPSDVKAMQKAFTDLSTEAKKSLGEIGKAFVPVLTDIAKTASHVITIMTPVFSAATKMIAGPFKVFVDTILKAFTSPAVQTSILAVSKAFIAILNAFTPDIPGIFNSFAEAITRMANAIAKNPKAFADFLNFMFQIVIAVIDAIAWLTVAANWIELHWSQIWEFAKIPVHGFVTFFEVIFTFLTGFIKMWAAIFTGNWTAAWNAIKNTAIGIWRLIARQAALIWDTINSAVGGRLNKLRHDTANIFDGIRHEIAHVWDIIHNNTYATVLHINQDMINLWNKGFHEVAVIFDGLRHDMAHWWDMIWNNTVGRIIRGINDVENLYHNFKSWLGNFFADSVSWLVNAGWNIIMGLWNGVRRGWNAFWNWLRGVPGWIISVFNGAPGWLYNAGSAIIGGLYNGIRSAMGGIGSWIKSNVVDPLVGAVKHFFGIASPSTVMMPIGKNITAGLIHGILAGGSSLANLIKNIFGGWPSALGALVNKGMVDVAKLPKKALDALGTVMGKVGGFASSLWHKVFGGGGSGVQQWAGTVMQALSMLHLPVGLTGQVLYQMQTESGGNPNAINNWDINAQQGDPSRGLLQVIGATFAAFHVPGTSGNIYDPLANIAAAINYALHRYGPTLMSGGMGMGSGHGYDQGGWWPPGTFGWNTSGKHELVVTQDQLSRQIGGTQYHAHFDGLTGAVIESHVRTAFQAMALTSGALARQGRRS